MSEGRVPFLDPRKTSCFVKTLLRSELAHSNENHNEYLTDLYHMLSKPKIPRGGCESEEKPSGRELTHIIPLTDQALPHFLLQHPAGTATTTEWNNFGSTWYSGNLGRAFRVGSRMAPLDCSSLLQMDFRLFFFFFFFTKRSRKAAVLVDYAAVTS